mmetsp:Transcript_29751/g.62343  ORF Transcript_29751/g.62343 Transcript_29751/m.62343 type:complete len:106 (-) Transcript_29751:12-329(-)
MPGHDEESMCINCGRRRQTHCGHTFPKAHEVPHPECSALLPDRAPRVVLPQPGEQSLQAWRTVHEVELVFHSEMTLEQCDISLDGLHREWFFGLARGYRCEVNRE